MNKHQNIKLSGDISSHQNGTAERTIKTVVTITSTMMMNFELRYTKNTISIDFGKLNWTIMYVCKIGSMIFSTVHQLLVKYQGKG